MHVSLESVMVLSIRFQHMKKYIHVLSNIILHAVANHFVHLAVQNDTQICQGMFFRGVQIFTLIKRTKSQSNLAACVVCTLCELQLKCQQ